MPAVVIAGAAHLAYLGYVRFVEQRPAAELSWPVCLAVAAALLVLAHRRGRFRPPFWRRGHASQVSGATR